MQRLVIVDVGEQHLPMRVTRMIYRDHLAAFHADPGVMRGFDMHYLLGGSARLRRGDGEWAVTAGDMVIRGPGDDARLIAERPTRLFHCHFDLPGVNSQTLNSSLAEWANLIGRTQPPALRRDQALLLPDVLQLSERARAVQLCQTMLAEQASANPGKLLTLKATFLLLLTLISQQTLRAIRTGSSVAIAASSRHLTAALDIISRRLDQPLSLHDLAQSLQVNGDYLGRLFRHYLGESAGSHIRRCKLARACQLLGDDRLNVKQVAAAVGFSDPLYFSRVFRRHLHMSPSDYARSCRL